MGKKPCGGSVILGGEFRYAFFTRGAVVVLACQKIVQGDIFGVLCIWLKFFYDFLVLEILGYKPPEDIFFIRLDEMRERAGEEGVETLVESRVAADELVLLDKGLERAGIFVTVLVQVGEGDQGVAERLDFLIQSQHGGFAIFPVAAFDRFHVQRCGIVEVLGVAFPSCFLLDLGQNFRLSFGLVRFVGLLVLLPEAGKFVPVVVHSKQVHCR